MPDPIDTLRNDIAELLSSNLDGIDMREDADQIVALLAAASGEQRRALLGILGYEVREGHGAFFQSGNWIAHPEPTMNSEHVLVLRDQRETAGPQVSFPDQQV